MEFRQIVLSREAVHLTKTYPQHGTTKAGLTLTGVTGLVSKRI